MNWLLLRGWARNQEHWLGFPERLQENKNIKRVVCLDLPGFGTEAHRVSPPTVDWIIEDLKYRFEKIKDDEQWSIFGHSLGGMIAMNWASQFRHDFKSVCLMNPSFRKFSMPYERLKPLAIPRLIQAARAKTVAEQEEKILGIVSFTGAEKEEAIQGWAKVSSSNPSRFYNVMSQLVAAAICRPPKKIYSPLLVLTGGQDKLVSPNCSKKLVEHFKGNISIHPNAGHDIVIDDENWVIHQLGQFTKAVVE